MGSMADPRPPPPIPEVSTDEVDEVEPEAGFLSGANKQKHRHGLWTLLGAPGIATRSKEATRGSWHRY